jgi:hypothetical protein
MATGSSSLWVGDRMFPPCHGTKMSSVVYRNVMYIIIFTIKFSQFYFSLFHIHTYLSNYTQYTINPNQVLKRRRLTKKNSISELHRYLKQI